VGVAYVTCGGEVKCIKEFGWVGLKERGKLEDRDINGGCIEMGRRGLILTQDSVVGGLLET
jgi:hypothetical protein